jgi:regulator of PEP synthase PpsR (kinase-PPPase family)
MWGSRADFMGQRIPLHVFVVSDATGRTAESVVKAVLVQFPDIEPRVSRFQNIRTQERILEILDQAQAVSAIVIYSFVSEALRLFIRKEGKRRDLILFDLLGPLISKVHTLFNLMPVSKPGLITHIHEESLRIADAINFTLNHDDGLGLDTIDEADLIILGVSRTSKTPTSFYVACNHHLKVANVPILPGRDIPEKIYQLSKLKVGFTISPERLGMLRKRRGKYLTDYADIRGVSREVLHSEDIFRRLHQIRVIDINDLSIEEIASKIMEARSLSS